MKPTLETIAAACCFFAIFWMVTFHLESVAFILWACVVVFPLSVATRLFEETARS